MRITFMLVAAVIAAASFQGSAQAQQERSPLSRTMETATPAQRSKIASCVAKETKTCVAPKCAAGVQADVERCMQPLGECQASKAMNCSIRVMGKAS